jgi:hypothetical protein
MALAAVDVDVSGRAHRIGLITRSGSAAFDVHGRVLEYAV